MTAAQLLAQNYSIEDKKLESVNTYFIVISFNYLAYLVEILGVKSKVKNR